MEIAYGGYRYGAVILATCMERDTHCFEKGLECQFFARKLIRPW
jgi:hypothetical protein